MDRILSVSDKSNAAIHALALAAAGRGRLTASLCASELGVSPSYLAKILQILVRGGLLTSSRGASGGFDLSSDPAALSCLEVIELVEGELPRRECFFRIAVCPQGCCALKTMCEGIDEAVTSALKSTSIAAIAASFA